MNSKFTTIGKYENIDIFATTYRDEKMLDVVRSIVDVDVPECDHMKGIHPTDNFGLKEWALYHALGAMCHGTMNGCTTKQVYEHYHGMGLCELEGLGW